MRLNGCRTESVMMPGLVIDMEDARLHTIAQVRAVLDGATEIAFRVPKAERYRFIERVLTRVGEASHGRVGKGVVLRYPERMTGRSRQQVTRLVRQYRTDGTLSHRHRPPPHGFPRRFTATDVAMLADVDARQGTVSGPATKKLRERALLLFGDARVERLAGISVSHLYNLRRGTPYQRTRRHWTTTRPTGVPIGQRRAPQPNGSPGAIRIDSGHQGDQDGVQGVYHLNAVDCVTQFQLVATCEKIREASLLPVIRQRLEGVPFVIRGFHADNGSEYIHDQVATLLEKRRIACTKSRLRQSNDTALAASKNGAVVRKHLGYAQIPQHGASLVNAFCADVLNPYVNFHRPCFFPETITDANGTERTRYRYEDMNTPDEKLKALSTARQHLNPGVTVEHLDAIA